MYRNFFKRCLDFLLALLSCLVLALPLLIIALFVRINLGSPVIFKQPRPGIKDKDGNETIFVMYKFRTMTDKRDENGNLLPDEQRLTPFGKTLRSLSLDELPEIFNILKGDMSVVGPRPLLVRDMAFMTPALRERHRVRPGLTGLAQVNGRNDLPWDQKLDTDLRYIEHISFLSDLKIILRTFKKVFIREGIAEDAEAGVSMDYGDYLLLNGRVDRETYDTLQQLSRSLIAARGTREMPALYRELNAVRLQKEPTAFEKSPNSPAD